MTMTQISRTTAKRCTKGMLLLSVFTTLISTTGCSQRYVVVDGGAQVTIKKSELDRLYQDNELLLSALEECRSGR